MNLGNRCVYVSTRLLRCSAQKTKDKRSSCTHPSLWSLLRTFVHKKVASWPHKINQLFFRNSITLQLGNSGFLAYSALWGCSVRGSKVWVNSELPLPWCCADILKPMSLSIMHAARDSNWEEPGWTALPLHGGEKLEGAKLDKGIWKRRVLILLGSISKFRAQKGALKGQEDTGFDLVQRAIRTAIEGKQERCFTKGCTEPTVQELNMYTLLILHNIETSHKTGGYRECTFPFLPASAEVWVIWVI